ncbi:MAG: BMP family protein [Anaerolineales bacterium]|nr:BMP family protein [Anaerolineales bacterium]
MKKRLLLLWMALLLVLAACGGDSSAPEEAAEEPESAAEPAEEAQAEEPAAEEMAEEEMAEEEMMLEPIRVAVVMPSATTDLAWSQAIFDSLLRLQAEYGEDVIEIAYTEGMFNVTDAAAALRDYAADGYDVVLAHGTQFGTSLFEIAPDFPETTFAYGTASDTGEAEGITNVHAYDAQAQEGGYINGVIAATISEAGIIGVVGPVEAGDAKRYIDGFVAGATATNPDIEVNIAYTGSFGDTALAAEVANTHLQAGADVLTGSAQQVVGAIGVAEEAGVPWLGTQADQSPLAPDIVVSSQLYDWDAMLLDIFHKHHEGVYGGTSYFLTLENEGLSMILSDDLSAEAVAAAEAARAGIIAGDIDPTSSEAVDLGAAEQEEMAEEPMLSLPELDSLRIAIVMPSATTDLAWSQSMYDALLAIQAMYPEGVVEISYSEGMFNVTDAAAALRDYAADGNHIVVAHGTQFGSSLFEIAPDFPETSFIYGTSSDFGEAEGLENVYAYDAQAQEGGYINGVIAATISEAGIIGVVGPVEAGDAKRYIDGFVAGVEATNPDAEVNIAYTGSFGDTALAAEVANTHLQAGADVLTGSAQQVVGAIGVAEEAGVPWLGTQADQGPLAPDIVVATQLYDWTGMLADIITKVSNGQYGGEAFFLTLENGGLTMIYGDQLSAETVAAAEAAVDAIIAGEIEIAD